VEAAGRARRRQKVELRGRRAQTSEVIVNDRLLYIEDLHLTRGEREVLSGVSLSIRPAEIHGLLGLNGSGKSSLAYTLMGCANYAPERGRIWFAGQDITRLTITERARLGLTLAWQEPARFEGLTVGDYLSLAAPALTRGDLWNALESVALAPSMYWSRFVDGTLSGGERKRIELAAVFAMSPKLAILDEPDSGVDVLSLGDVVALIRRMSERGTAVLLITHRDEMVSEVDSASLMCQGSIVYQGEPQKVREYYGKRCRLHAEAIGAQPWGDAHRFTPADAANNG
jgi:Fe-S cluster assembly ATP-binding protein